MVLSSGLHGAEGFLGSGIQLVPLEKYRNMAPLSGRKLVLIHSLIPYGSAWLWRWNEDNIDLNRNFLLSDEIFRGSPTDYLKFDSLFARVDR
jgi:hypothetical protein